MIAVADEFKSFNDIIPSDKSRSWDVPGYPDEKYSIKLRENGSPIFPAAVQLPSYRRMEQKRIAVAETLSEEEIAALKATYGQTWRDYVPVRVTIDDQIEEIVQYMQLQGCKLQTSDLLKNTDIDKLREMVRWIHFGNETPPPESETKPQPGKQGSGSKKKRRA